MPGTVVRDALAVNLLPADLATDATANGTANEIGWPGWVQFVLTTGTVAGINKIVVQGCETSDFSTADVVTIGTIDVIATDDNVTRAITSFVDSKYVRAVATIGTGGDMVGSTLYAVLPHDRRVRSVHPTASALA